MSELSSGWQWTDLDPLTRSVVAVFAWRIGDTERGDISARELIDAVTQSFPDITEEDIIKTRDWFGADGLRRKVALEMSSIESQRVTEMTQKLGELAGTSEGVIALINQTDNLLQNPHRNSDAIPALQVLSEMAISRRA